MSGPVRFDVDWIPTAARMGLASVAIPLRGELTTRDPQLILDDGKIALSSGSSSFNAGLLFPEFEYNLGLYNISTTAHSLPLARNNKEVKASTSTPISNDMDALPLP
jgi:hypothetical protein